MTRMTACAAALTFAAHTALAAISLEARPDGLGGSLGASLVNEISAAESRALQWLAATQKEDGSWSNSDFPALTALCTWAFIRSDTPGHEPVVKKALAYLVSCVQPDGGIYRTIPDRKGGGLSNYNTAICMTTLHATGDPSLRPIVLNARRFVANSQLTGDDQYAGGFGYDARTDRAYTDLMNTLYSAEAMRFTESAEDSRPAGEARVDINWQKTAEFVSRLQNTSETGTNDAGGFIYKPGESKAGSFTNSAGKLVLRSYGSMTYAGLLALIYAEVDRNDPRVRSAYDWARNHWSLDENPGMGQEGLFFFYNVMARSLNAFGTRVVETSDKTYIDWRKDLCSKLIASQKIDPDRGGGFWINETNRYWEADPVLVTAYSLLALQDAAGRQRSQ